MSNPRNEADQTASQEQQHERETPTPPVSPSGASSLLRKATQRVINREGKEGPSDLKRQFIKIKNQAAAPTMSYAEANAEMRWVKSQQRIIQNMKVDVATKHVGGLSAKKKLETSAHLDPNNIYNLNRRVEVVRMNLIKATLDASQQQEDRDDSTMERDDLDIHYGREAVESRKRPMRSRREHVPIAT